MLSDFRWHYNYALLRKVRVFVEFSLAVAVGLIIVNCFRGISLRIFRTLNLTVLIVYF